MSSIRRKLFCLCVGAILAIVACPTTQAAPIAAYTATESNLSRNGGAFVIGFRFQVNQAINVTDLGYSSLGGFMGSHQVGIFTEEATPTLLVSTNVVIPASSNTDSTQYLYTSITPQLLMPGTYRIGGLAYTGSNEDPNGDGFIYTNSGGYIDTSSAVTYLNGVFANGGLFTYPSVIHPSANFFNTNFQFEVATLPEPTGVGMLMLSLTALTRRKRRAS